MTNLRKKELKRVKGIINRLNKKGISIEEDITGWSTKELRSIHSGLELRRELNRRKEESPSKKLARHKRQVVRRVKDMKYAGTKVVDLIAGERTDWDNDGEHIQRLEVFSGTDATIQMDMLLGIAEYGKYYSGRRLEYTEDKSGRTAVDYINDNGEEITNLIMEARRHYSDEVLVKTIEQSEHGSVRELGRMLEKLILAIYDRTSFSGGQYLAEFDNKMESLRILLLDLPAQTKGLIEEEA